MRIKTDDPNQIWLEVAVTGRVEKFAEIRPERVRLAGRAGQSLSAEIEIVPRKEYPFSVQAVKARTGDFIHFEIKERCADGRNRCLVRVENTKVEKGRYVDALYILTDSKIRPSIPVYVTGMIQ